MGHYYSTKYVTYLPENQVLGFLFGKNSDICITSRTNMETNIVNQENITQKVEAALDSIRPYLEADGGNVRVLEVTPEGVARLEMLGSCGACPMSPMTLKAGVEEAIKREVPEIVRVEAVNVPAL